MVTLLNLGLEFVRATELAAIAAARWIGRGNGKAADKAAVDAMRSKFNQIAFDGLIVIGEGAKDEAPELYIGEKLGTGNGPAIDIAVDPLECTDSVAFGRPNALTVIVTAPRGGIYQAADSYMEKIAVGPEAADCGINLDDSTIVNLRRIAWSLGKQISEVTVAVLDRPRHAQLIAEIRASGARIQLFTDGDVAMAIATCMRESPIDVLMGIGGSTEAVLAAAALKCYGGEMLCRWKPKDEHLERLRIQGVTDFGKILKVDDLITERDVTFTATGVIDGPLLDGVVFKRNKIVTHSLVISGHQKMTRRIKTDHNLLYEMEKIGDLTIAS